MNDVTLEWKMRENCGYGNIVIDCVRCGATKDKSRLVTTPSVRGTEGLSL
jgi:hypothetical protein